MARGSFRSPLAPDSSGRSRGDPDDPYDPYAPRAARRRPRRPEEPAPIERALSGLVADPLYWQDQDEDYFQHVRRQYAQVYGSGKVARDATGRQREAAPKPEYAEGRRGLDWFAPKPKPQDLHPRGPVGRGVSTGSVAPQAAGSRRPGTSTKAPGNARRDVVGLQKALAGTGWYHWQPPHEPSGQVTEALDAAIRAFQQAHGLTVDGLVTPDGPTLRSLAQAAGLPLQAPDQNAGHTPGDQHPDTPTEPTPDPEPEPRDQPDMVPRDDDLTECQKLSSRIKHHAYIVASGKAGIESAKRQLETIDETLADLETRISKALRAQWGFDVSQFAEKFAVPQNRARPLLSVLAVLRRFLRDELRQGDKPREDGTGRANLPSSGSGAKALSQLLDEAAFLAEQRNELEGYITDRTQKIEESKAELATLEPEFESKCSHSAPPEHQQGAGGTASSAA